MSRAAVATLVAVVLLASLAASPVAATLGQDRMQTPDDFETTRFQITLHENGSATWTIQHYQPLDNETEVERFEAYASDFESNETALYRDFRSDASALTRTGTDQTGREMTARNFHRSAGVLPGQSRGTVRMSFLWTNFSRVSADSIVVSDVFEGGFYLGPSQSLVFEHDTSMAFTAVEPGPDAQSDPQSVADSESITFSGERSFNDSRPYVKLGPPSAAGTDTASQDTVANASAVPGETMWQLALLLAVAALGAVAAAAWRSGAAAAVLGSDDDGGAATASSDTPAPDTGVTDSELLNDEDRVIKLLEDNGGRMKQVDIVETTEWSKSKVSMLLSDMEEAGDISKLRVGRENIISLAGEEPDAAGSPFDEE